jgi:hypothetical protein
MPVLIGQGSLPSEFTEIIQMRLLVQPEPQYLHCRWWKTALRVAFDAMMAEQLGISPERALPSPGGPYTQPDADRLNYSDDIIAPEAIVVVPSLGARPGDVIKTNRPVYQDSTYSLAARTVPSSTEISTEPIALAGEQVGISVLRLAGPYSNEQSAVAPYGLERFDIQRMIHAARGYVGLHLSRDFDKLIDTIMVTLYDALGTVVRPKGMADEESPQVAGDYPMSHTVLTEIEQRLKEANVPTFPDGRWIGVLTPQQEQQLKNDDAFVKQARYFKETSPLYVGNIVAEWGRRLRLYCSNTMPIYPPGTTLDNGKTPAVPIHNAHFFGPGVIGSGVGQMPRPATSTQDNYGEWALLLWIMYAGFTMFDNRLGLKVQTS